VIFANKPRYIASPEGSADVPPVLRRKLSICLTEFRHHFALLAIVTLGPRLEGVG
jgi:hypothetical protein